MEDSRFQGGFKLLSSLIKEYNLIRNDEDKLSIVHDSEFLFSEGKYPTYYATLSVYCKGICLFSSRNDQSSLAYHSFDFVIDKMSYSTILYFFKMAV